MIIDGGDAPIGLESTIVDLTSDRPTVLRPGYITRQQLEEVLSQVEEDSTLMRDDSGQTPKAPGMKYRHYAPKGDLTIVRGTQEAVTAYINARCQELKEKNKKTGVIGSGAVSGKYHADVCKSVGERGDEEAAARELYRILREFDDECVEVIYAEAFAESGVGRAVMNRLLKAAGYRVEEV